MSDKTKESVVNPNTLQPGSISVLPPSIPEVLKPLLETLNSTLKDLQRARDQVYELKQRVHDLERLLEWERQEGTSSGTKYSPF